MRPYCMRAVNRRRAAVTAGRATFLFPRHITLERPLIGKKDLIGRCFILKLAEIVITRVLPADVRPLRINGAAVFLEVAADERDFEQPLAAVVNAHLDVFVHQIPAYSIEIGFGFGRVDFERDVAAAKAVAGAAGR